MHWEVVILISSNNDPNAFQFEWCFGFTFENFQQKVEKFGHRMARICYISTEVYRIYLVHSEDSGFFYCPYMLANNAWKMLPRHNWHVKDVSTIVFSSVQELRRSLEFQIIYQWRDSIEGWRCSPPDHEEVLDSAKDGDSLDVLRRQHIRFYEAEVQQDPEWDGAVQIWCMDGILLIPYVNGDTDKDPVMLMRYATFIPDSKVKCIGSKVSKFIDKLTSSVQNIRWSYIRNFVNGIGGQHG